MTLEFTKMQGTGNDFVIIDATSRPVSLSAEQIRRLADRHYGVGCDQVLLIEPPTRPGVDFRYRIFNADGGEVEQCGNGARCFARYVYDHGLTDRTELNVETLAGVIQPRIESDGRVTVDMGVPRLDPSAVPFVAATQEPSYELELPGRGAVTISAVSMGNPHAVIVTPDAAAAPIAEWGPAVSRHPRFPRQANVGFMEVADRGHIRLRVYERGVGETLACGTGACAAVVAGRRLGLLDEEVAVDLPGGRLSIAWAGDGQTVRLTGPAEYVFEGRIEL